MNPPEAGKRGYTQIGGDARLRRMNSDIPALQAAGGRFVEPHAQQDQAEAWPTASAPDDLRYREGGRAPVTTQEGMACSRDIHLLRPA